MRQTERRRHPLPGFESFDVVVAGGGPAGATTAHALALSGVRVAVLDKAVFPRDKTCGGGLEAKLLPHLLVDPRPVIRTATRRVGFSYRLQDRFDRVSDEPLIYGVRRIEFDQYLLRQAVAAGAELREGVAVRGFEHGDRGRVRVQTDTGPIHCQVLIGADGANGVVRRTLNSDDAFFQQVGLSCEIDRERLDPTRMDDQRSRVDWGSVPGGYAWLFPKRETVNIGAGAPISSARRLRPYLQAFLTAEGILGRTHRREALDIRGHKLLSVTRRTKFVQGSVLLVGDAAGLIEPLTGDGLSYGIRSARLAADHTLRWLTGDGHALDQYAPALAREILPDLTQGHRLMCSFHMLIGAVYGSLKRDDGAWRDMCSVIRGTATFEEFHANRLGRLRVLKPLLDSLARLHAEARLRSPRTRALVPVATRGAAATFQSLWPV